MEQTTDNTATTDRPASIEAAMASVEDSSSSPPAQETQTSEPAAATATSSPEGTEATQATSTETTETTKGEPPKWRWQDILSNARETAAKEAEARIRQEVETQYGGLKDFATLDPTERTGLLVLHRAMAGDAQSREMVAQAQPALAQSLGWTKAAPAADDAMPEPDLQTGDGTPVYSAPQLQKWQEWNQRKLRAELQAEYRKELQPVNEVISAHQNAKAHADVTSVLTELRADPDFKAHEADIKATLKSDAKLWALADSDPRMALELAYARVFREKVLPAREKTLKETSEASVLTSLQQKAAATTGNPATATSATPRRPRSMAEALEQQSAA